jgi:hypothetical protein
MDTCDAVLARAGYSADPFSYLLLGLSDQPAPSKATMIFLR